MSEMLPTTTNGIAFEKCQGYKFLESTKRLYRAYKMNTLALEGAGSASDML